MIALIQVMKNGDTKRVLINPSSIAFVEPAPAHVSSAARTIVTRRSDHFPDSPYNNLWVANPMQSIEEQLNTTPGIDDSFKPDFNNDKYL